MKQALKCRECSKKHERKAFCYPHISIDKNVKQDQERIRTRTDARKETVDLKRVTQSVVNFISLFMNRFHQQENIATLSMSTQTIKWLTYDELLSDILKHFAMIWVFIRIEQGLSCNNRSRYDHKQRTTGIVFIVDDCDHSTLSIWQASQTTKYFYLYLLRENNNQYYTSLTGCVYCTITINNIHFSMLLIIMLIGIKKL